MEQIILNTERRSNDIGIRKKEMFTPPRILACGFALIILFGAAMLMLPFATADGKGLGFLDALFTATSAVCVTGLVVVDTGTVLSVFGQLVVLSLIQVGGLGFMTFATLLAILLGRKITLKERLLLQEALNQVSLEGIVRLAKYVIQVAFAIEAVGAILLSIAWLPDMGWKKAIYFGVFHAVSAFNNAGFDVFGNFTSLTSYQHDLTTNVVVMILILAGGFGFAVLADLYNAPRGKKLSFHSRIVLKTSAVLIVLGAVVIFLLEFTNPATIGELSLFDKVTAALFQSITPRTAGFNTISISDMRNTTQFFIILLMFIGASPGSCGGGIKTTTFITLVLSVMSTLKGKCQVTIKDRALSKDMLPKALSITLASALLVITTTLFLTITEKNDFLVILFEAVSAFGTVGLSMGITTLLSSPGKMAVIFTMFCGRIGPLTLAYALGQRKNGSSGDSLGGSRIKFPEEKIIIG